MINIRFAQLADGSSILEFLRTEWSADHIFCEAPEVFHWQHQDASGRLNFMIAENTEEPDRLLGVLGFIPTSHYHAGLGATDTDLALAIWKVRDGAPPGLGLRLLKHLTNELRPRTVSAIGISHVVGPIYKVLRYEVGRMKQAALFNPSKRHLTNVAIGVPEEAFVDGQTGRSASREISLRPLTIDASAADREAVDALGSVALPMKSWGYVVGRYLEHPWFTYDVRAVCQNDAIVAVAVWRMVKVAQTNVLRIVDVIGEVNWLAHAAWPLRRVLGDIDAEYIDIVYWGIDESVLRAGSFVSWSDHPGLVIPNYFSPFEQRNVEVEFAFRVSSSSEGFPARLFRADSDQDRPNRVTDLAPLT